MRSVKVPVQSLVDGPRLTPPHPKSCGIAPTQRHAIPKSGWGGGWHKALVVGGGGERCELV